MDDSSVSAIALDLGTTTIKAGLLGRDGKLECVTSVAAPSITAKAGSYESDALSYAETAERVLGACLKNTQGLPPLGLCSQRSSFLIWERKSGMPVTSLISWQDNRGLASCEALRDSESMVSTLSGLRLTPYYFAPKLRVLLRQHPEWRMRLELGELLVGTLDSFMIWRGTQGMHHVTDASMAARTQLMDIRQQRWSPDLCALFDIPAFMLPRIIPSSGMNLKLNNGLTLQASLGDQSAALIASVGKCSTDVLINLGTGGFALRYLATQEDRRDGYLRTLVFQDSKAHIAIEGTLNSLAAAISPYPVAECRPEDLAKNDIYCLAEPSGLGAPYFRADLGLMFSEPVEHLNPYQTGCLLLEGIIFRVVRMLEDFNRLFAIERIYLSGGLSHLRCLQQGIAECIPFDIYRLEQQEASLQGAAMLACGMETAVCRDSYKISRSMSGLPEKYRGWTAWFDGLLEPN